MPDEDREREPPDPIPNSEVKPFIADGSVGPPHVRVGHRQASNKKSPPRKRRVFFDSNLPNLSGNHSIVAPPDPIPNSEVKRNRADGSVGSPHVRVGHFQAPN